MTQEYPSLRDVSRKPSSQIALGIVIGAALASGLMYLLDPRQGNRRRAVAWDRTRHLVNRSSWFTGKMYRHSRNRLSGVFSSITHALRPEGGVSDRKLIDRIRSTIGRTVTHPQAVDFSAHEGRVTVRGYLKPHEAGQVVLAVEKIPGVRSVDNQIVDSSQAEHPVQ
jgi:hypothetical protein